MRLVLDREETAELLAHANFPERRVEVHRRARADAVIGNVAALHHLAELLGVPHDLEAALGFVCLDLLDTLLEGGVIVQLLEVVLEFGSGQPFYAGLDEVLELKLLAVHIFNFI